MKGKKVLVLGLGETGMSMTRWLARHGAIVTAADTRADPPHAAALGRELPAVTLERGEFRAASLNATDLWPFPATFWNEARTNGLWAEAGGK